MTELRSSYEISGLVYTLGRADDELNLVTYLALQGAAEAENARRGSLDNLRRDRMLALRAPDSGGSIHLGTGIYNVRRILEM